MRKKRIKFTFPDTMLRSEAMALKRSMLKKSCRTTFKVVHGHSIPHDRLIQLNKMDHVSIEGIKYKVLTWEKRLYFFYDKKSDSVNSIGFKFVPKLLIKKR